MSQPIAEHHRRRRYRRAGGCAPPRLVALKRPEITHWALGPVPDDWRPRRHWVLTSPTPPIYDLVLVGCREQLLGFGAELERVLAAEVAAATATCRPQLNLWDEPPTSPVEPPGRRGRARPRADGARVGGNLGLHARGGA